MHRTYLDLHDFGPGLVKEAGIGVPDEVGSSHFPSEDELDNYPDEDFALIMVDGSERFRKFACMSPGTAWLNTMCLLGSWDRMPKTAAVLAGTNLMHVLEGTSTPPPMELVEKVASALNESLHGEGELVYFGDTPVVDITDLSAEKKAFFRAAGEGFKMLGRAAKGSYQAGRQAATAAGQGGAGWGGQMAAGAKAMGGAAGQFARASGAGLQEAGRGVARSKNLLAKRDVTRTAPQNWAKAVGNVSRNAKYAPGTNLAAAGAATAGGAAALGAGAYGAKRMLGRPKQAGVAGTGYMMGRRKRASASMEGYNWSTALKGNKRPESAAGARSLVKEYHNKNEFFELGGRALSKSQAVQALQNPSTFKQVGHVSLQPGVNKAQALLSLNKDMRKQAGAKTTAGIAAATAMGGAVLGHKRGKKKGKAEGFSAGFGSGSQKGYWSGRRQGYQLGTDHSQRAAMVQRIKRLEAGQTKEALSKELKARAADKARERRKGLENAEKSFFDISRNSENRHVREGARLINKDIDKSKGRRLRQELKFRGLMDPSATADYLRPGGAKDSRHIDRVARADRRAPSSPPAPRKRSKLFFKTPKIKARLDSPKSRPIPRSSSPRATGGALAAAGALAAGGAYVMHRQRKAEQARENQKTAAGFSLTGTNTSTTAPQGRKRSLLSYRGWTPGEAGAAGAAGGLGAAGIAKHTGLLGKMKGGRLGAVAAGTTALGAGSGMLQQKLFNRPKTAAPSTLLRGDYPVENPEQIKQAEAFFDEHWQRLHPSDRRTYATNLVKAALAHGVYPTSENLEKYAGDAVSTEAVLHLNARAKYVDDYGREVLIKLAEEIPTADPDYLADALTQVDEHYGISQKWDTHVVDPYAAILTKSASEDFRWSEGPDTVTGDQLVAASKEKRIPLTTALGDDGFYEFAKAPVAVFESLPSDVKHVISRISA